MAERFREDPIGAELEKSENAFDEIFSMVDRNMPKEEIDDKVQNVIEYLRRIRDPRIATRFLDMEFDLVNRDWRFDARKRLMLKQIIWNIRDSLTPAPLPTPAQPNFIETRESLPASVTIRLIWGQIERNILWKWKKMLHLNSVSNPITVLNKWELAENILKFSEKTWSFLKWAETVELSFYYDTESGLIKIFSKDRFSGEQQLLDTVILGRRRRSSDSKIILPDWWYIIVDFKW
ncbi:MAG: hypothetical protein ACD_2C00162G0003 [uncultured bacterium (gcode 4)]|uniref:Uncharacterized protein n=1 Tax=uncultured bacterium (gcode 4) TaxID=1234023 RepID=K2G2R0_9BACT|nr:MAG: hypothetical protein ACD_2C00162G0003 [uncultured bacterium (gcode 4)]